VRTVPFFIHTRIGIGFDEAIAVRIVLRSLFDSCAAREMIWSAMVFFCASLLSSLGCIDKLIIRV